MIVSEAASDADMADVRRLRHEVFVIEQNVPQALEWDGRDGEACHLILRDEGDAVGTLRWRVLGDLAKVERVCVSRAVRGRGAGSLLMRQVLRDISGTPGLRQVKLGAQVSVIGFYETLGFVAEGPVYDDAGIPHRDMVRKLCTVADAGGAP